MANKEIDLELESAMQSIANARAAQRKKETEIRNLKKQLAAATAQKSDLRRKVTALKKELRESQSSPDLETTDAAAATGATPSVDKISAAPGKQTARIQLTDAARRLVHSVDRRERLGNGMERPYIDYDRFNATQHI